jgi:glycerol-3-phosphate dehydrogenase
MCRGEGMYDVIIVGAGIVGCAVARALSRFDIRLLVLEQGSDIAAGATKANSGMLHAGYDCAPGTLKAALNVKGLGMFTALAKELDIPCQNNGSMVVSTHQNGWTTLQELYERGQKNGVPRLSLLDASQAKHLEPNLHPDVNGALLAQTACIISPYEAAIALAENAAANGAVFLRETPVINIAAHPSYYTVTTSAGAYDTRVVVNAAGISSADLHNLVCEAKEQISPKRGQYYILDSTRRDWVTRTLFPLPSKHGKGILVTPTVDGNILLGPASDDGSDTDTTRTELAQVLNGVSRILNSVPAQDKIAAFAGIRAKHASRDFVINEPRPGFINALGIDSPGLTAAPAIAEMLADMTANRLQPAYKKDFVATRVGLRQSPASGSVVCRCEIVTESYITEAIQRPVGARDLDGLKRRTRAQMGRCQGGFCTLRLMEILSEELGIPEKAVTKCGKGSELIL